MWHYNVIAGIIQIMGSFCLKPIPPNRSLAGYFWGQGKWFSGRNYIDRLLYE